MPEMKIDLDTDGRVTGAHLAQTPKTIKSSKSSCSPQRGGRRKLAEAGLIFLRRVHGSPDPRRCASSPNFVRELGYESRIWKIASSCKSLLDTVKATTRQHASTTPRSARCNAPPTAPKTKATTPSPAIATATSRRPSAAIQTFTIHRLIDVLNRG